MTNRGCLDDSELARYLDGGLEAEERGRTEEHLSGCRSCRSRLAAEYRSRDEPPAVVAPAELRRRARATAERGASPRRLRALAAVLVAGLGLSALVFQARRDTAPDPETVRAGPAAGPRLVTPGPGEVLADGRTAFRWRPVPEARRYTLSVVDPLGEVVHRETTTEPEAEIGPEVFEPGGDYYWYVGVLLEDGSSLESDVRRFRRRRD